MNLDEIEKITSAFSASVTALAIIIGGAAAYFKFFIGRVHAWRLETKLSGCVHRSARNDLLTISAEVKNIGVSRATIEHQIEDIEGTFLYVYGANFSSDLSFARNVKWKKLGTYEAFLRQVAIESGESLSDYWLIELPQGEYTSFKMELSVTSRRPKWMWWRKKGTTWNVSAIVNSTP